MGFGDLSYENIRNAAGGGASEIDNARVVVAHLASDTSLCAIHEGSSGDCTYGFTPLLLAAPLDLRSHD